MYRAPVERTVLRKSNDVYGDAAADTTAALSTWQEGRMGPVPCISSEGMNRGRKGCCGFFEAQCDRVFEVPQRFCFRVPWLATSALTHWATKQLLPLLQPPRDSSS